MKKILIALSALAFTAGIVQAQVTSVNAVGMVSITVPADGGLFLARYDFVPEGGGAVPVTDLLGLDVPAGTTIFVWDRVNQNFVLPAPTLTSFLGEKSWSRTDLTVLAGDAFFIKNASGAEAFNVTFSGEVPGESNSSSTISLTNVLGFIGYPFPVETNWEDTGLADQVPVGSTLFVWNPDAQSYDLPGPTKTSFLGDVSWSGNPVIEVGHGFWVTTSDTPPTVNETKPYLWP